MPVTPLPDPKLSIIMPVFNEIATIEEIIGRVLAAPFEKELIIVDDCSVDGTKEYLGTLNNETVRVLFQDHNQGKGAAVARGFREASGDIVIIQDADLEYYPEEYPQVVKLIVDGKADVVYGSRFLGVHRVFMFTHYLGNMILNLITNALYNTTLTDMETCYKAIRSEVLKGLTINEKRFGVEPELTAKIFKKKLRVYEVPISYDGRTYEEGKKIRMKDGFRALWVLLKYRFVD